MADKVKEFFNAEIPLSEFTANKKTLFTTDATTTAVIRDVNSNGMYCDVNAKLTINGTDVMSLDISGEGTEIVGINSTVEVAIDGNQITHQVLNYPSDSGDIITITAEYLLEGKDFASMTREFADVGDFNLSQIDGGYWLTAYGNLYTHSHDGNSNTALYSGIIAVTGGSGAYHYKTFDGVDTFYWLSGANQIQKVIDSPSGPGNVQSLTINGGSGLPAPSTYTRATYCNGRLWVVPGNAYTTTIWAIDPTTLSAVRINGLYSIPSGDNLRLAVSYDAAADEYIIIRCYGSSTIYFDKLAAGLVIDNTTQSPAITKTNFNVLGANTQYYQHLSVNNNGTVVWGDLSSTDVHSIDIATGVLTTVDTLPNIPYNGSIYWGAKTVATQADAGLANLKLRITGVETTGV